LWAELRELLNVELKPRTHVLWLAPHQKNLLVPVISSRSSKKAVSIAKKKKNRCYLEEERIGQI
jgi:hypothetical protein